MKLIPAISSAALLGLTACETLNQPITSDDFDPLRPPGSAMSTTTRSGDTGAFKAGQFVQTLMDNTAFYLKKPKGDAEADKLLKRATSVKVVSNTDSYTKVELDSGEVGFIPSIMLTDPAATPTAASTPNPGEYQVYPPLPGGGPVEPLPVIDPAGMPPADAIPTVIDPDAPAAGAVPDPVTPPTEMFPAPVPTQPAPGPTEQKYKAPQ